MFWAMDYYSTNYYSTFILIYSTIIQLITEMETAQYCFLNGMGHFLLLFHVNKELLKLALSQLRGVHLPQYPLL